MPGFPGNVRGEVLFSGSPRQGFVVLLAPCHLGQVSEKRGAYPWRSPSGQRALRLLAPTRVRFHGQELPLPMCTSQPFWTMLGALLDEGGTHAPSNDGGDDSHQGPQRR